MAALAKTRCFKTTSTEAVQALAGMPPIDMVAQEMLVQQYCHGTLRRDQEALKGDCEWSPRFTFVKAVLDDAGVRLDGMDFERRVLDHERPYPPERRALDVTLGSREEWAKDMIEDVWRAGGRVIFTDGSKMPEKGVGAAYVAMGPGGEVEASGLFKLPDYCTVYQAEAVALRESQKRVESREERRLMASDSRAVLSSVSGQSRMTTLVAEIADGARAGDSFLYIPGHQGHAGNEKADELAKLAVEMGEEVQVPVPRAHTRQLARERTWRRWAEEWSALRALEEDGGQAQGGGKAYFKFAPGLGDLKANVWGNDKVDSCVLQLLSGHCNLGAYLHRFGRRDTPECTFCGKDEESVGHFLLECKRWDRERNEISDLIDKGNEEASLQALLQEVGRLARFVRLTGRLEIRRGER